MTTTISQPVRIAALLGLAAALALGGALMVLGRHTTSPTAPVVPKQHPRTAVIAPSAPAQSEPSVKPATKPAAPVSTRPAAEVAALKAGLPLPLAEALGRHPVVVVEITDPQSELDSIALAEAQAGAATARAGFVSLNVLSKAEIGKLTRLTGGLLPDPGLLIYTRPAKLVSRFDGFVDKQTAAQAALNAARGS